MNSIYFRVWHHKESKMYYRGYQKMTHVLLCEDDQGTNGGRGTPVKDASYDDCDMMQGTGIEDGEGREIFEGDLVEIQTRHKKIQGILESIPDMFKSRNLHPLHALLSSHGINDDEALLAIKVLGNRYENKNRKQVRSPESRES